MYKPAARASNSSFFNVPLEASPFDPVEIHNAIALELFGLPCEGFVEAFCMGDAEIMNIARQMMLKSYHSAAEIKELHRQFSKPEFLETKIKKASCVQSNDKTQDDINRISYKQKLEEEFKKSSPISKEQIQTVARTIDPNDCAIFTNPSASIRATWNNSRWERYCYAAIELSKNCNHKDALSH